MQSIANLINQLLDELKVVSYDIVGHSMGGYVALEVKKITTLVIKLSYSILIFGKILP